MPTIRSGLKAQIPALEPPEGQALSVGNAGQSQPSPVTTAELSSLAQTDLTLATPVEQPPVAAGGITGTWTDGQILDALWTINENRNSWARVAGGNWVKLLNSSDPVTMALSALAANAKLTKGQVKFRTEADNMVHEIYVW